MIERFLLSVVVRLYTMRPISDLKAHSVGEKGEEAVCQIYSASVALNSDEWTADIKPSGQGDRLRRREYYNCISSEFFLRNTITVTPNLTSIAVKNLTLTCGTIQVS